MLIVAVLGAAQKSNPVAPLASRIDAIVNAPNLQRETFAVQVVSLKTGQVLYARGAEKLLQPASNAKLFTTAAAFAMIAPDYKSLTTLESATQPDSHGRIAGDLALVGRGDPNLSGRVLPYHGKTEYQPDSLAALEDLANQLAGAGVKEIDGDIVGDDSYYLFAYPDGWTRDDLQWDYGAAISALSVNDNRFFLDIAPGDHLGDKAFLHLEPESDAVVIDNRLTTGAAESASSMAIERIPGSDRITVWGSVPLGAATHGEELAVEDPALFAAKLMRGVLLKRGIVVRGGARAKHLLAMDTPGTPMISVQTTSNNTPSHGVIGTSYVLARRESAPLIQDLQVINKVSHNLHAELALCLLGKLRGRSGSTAGGLEVLRGFLAQAGIGDDEVFLRDGSGLSRETLATPEAIVKLLRFAAAQPWGKQFAETLPQSGVDGGLRKRFEGSPVKDHIRAKTGTYEHVRSLSGYAETASGDRVAFSILMNGSAKDTSAAVDAMNKMAEQIVLDK